MPYERVKWRTNKDGTRRGYKYLVESYREGKKVKQRTLEYLGPVGHEVGTTLASRVGTTKTNFKQDFQQEYDLMYAERKGSMVRIPDLWQKMKNKGYSRKEFEKELFAMEKKREIELQTASDPRLVKDKKDAIDHPSRGLITYVVWRKPTSTSKKSKKKRARRKYDKYECGVCGKQFQNKKTLSWHLKDSHSYVGTTLSTEEKMIELEEWH
jgi:hypothetical protein